MKLYRFITGPDDSAFCMRITQLLNNGWKLNGNPVLTFNGKSTIAGQSVIKKIKDKKFNKDIDLTKY